MVSEDKSIAALRKAILSNQSTEGNGEVLFQQVYDLLRHVARTRLGKERGVRSFRATDLVHDAWLQLGDTTFANHEEACAFASVAIRHLLVDAARKRAAEKRGGGWTRVSLEAAGEVAHDRRHTADLLELDAAMRELAVVDERAAKVVELRYFGGMSNEEIAVAIHASERTVRTAYASGIEWLKQRVAIAGAA